MPRRHRRLGLRSRVTAAFALGALVLSVSLSTLTYFTARQYFLHERQTAVLRQAYVNANLVRAALRSPQPDIPPLLASLDTAPGSRSVLYDRGRWFATSLTVGRDALPAHLRGQVTGGTPASQRFNLAGSLQMGVGIPIPVVGAAYFEVFSLQELDHSLRILALTLAAGSVAITIAGVFIGRWASGRALRPLGDVAHAAVAIAGGRLDTRLETFDEADLATLASSFNRMADRLQERIESPLTTLSTAIGVLEARRDDLPQRSRRALDLLAAELRRFQRMVSDLLEISRFDTGSAELSLDDVRVDELVQHAVHAGENGALPVELAPDVAGLQVAVDKRRIERVVANLVDNAAVYAGGVTRLAVEASDDRVRLIVEDAGPGVPAEGRERIFERFFRGSAAGRRGAGDGTGLGLALVAEHVRLHGGRVWVDDRPGGGSRFVAEAASV
ncbi:MAG: HAMP domain-containing histidine kinase [Actinobacteria bacterium]|nr:MAG: HAMP domain-containing histidine kinase [Actinomycetota bacterium]